jgi:hypothetical protein
MWVNTGDDLNMPAASSVEIGNASVFFAQLAYFPDIVSLFTQSDFKEQLDPDDDAYSFYGYVSSALLIRQRLTVLGVTSQAAMDELDSAIRRAQSDEGESVSEQAEATDGKQAEAPDGFPADPLTRDEVLARAKAFLEWELDTDNLEFPEQYEDPRVFDEISTKHHFRILLDLVPGETRVELDLTDLKNDTCCYTMPAQLAAEVHKERHRYMSTSLPLLVLTEGSTDARALEESIRVTHAHLVDFIKFMDFDFKPDGGVSSLIKNLKALVAAGIPNRIVAVADNDAAAREALSGEFLATLPNTVRVLHYPELESLRKYPTYDVEGDIVELDVNGRAGSLEMYHGSDVLTVDGKRPPVRWTGYQTKVSTYQGVVDFKGDLGKKFHKKVKAQLEKLEQSPAAGLEGDWHGMREIIESIVHAFD